VSVSDPFGKERSGS